MRSGGLPAATGNSLENIGIWTAAPVCAVHRMWRQRSKPLGPKAWVYAAGEKAALDGIQQGKQKDIKKKRQLVYPECGETAGSGKFCQSCGHRLATDLPPSFGVPTAMCRFPSMQVLSGVRGETGGLRGVILQTKAGTEHEG